MSRSRSVRNHKKNAMQIMSRHATVPAANAGTVPTPRDFATIIGVLLIFQLKLLTAANAEGPGSELELGIRILERILQRA